MAEYAAYIPVGVEMDLHPIDSVFACDDDMAREMLMRKLDSKKDLKRLWMCTGALIGIKSGEPSQMD